MTPEFDPQQLHDIAAELNADPNRVAALLNEYLQMQEADPIDNLLIIGFSIRERVEQQCRVEARVIHYLVNRHAHIHALDLVGEMKSQIENQLITDVIRNLLRPQEPDTK